MAPAVAVRNCVLQQVITNLLVCTALLICVEADYRLEIQFTQMDNPTGMCGDPRCAANQGCCDPPTPEQQQRQNPCMNLCGYHPRFCVRPLGTESNSTSDCLEGLSLTGIAKNADLQSFVIGNGVFFGTPNPAVFTGPRWPGGIQLFMEVHDLDNGLDAELVDRFAVDASVSVGSNITTTDTGVFGLMELRVNFRVMCVESFFVLDCTTCFGVNRDPSTNCSGCLAGYEGSNCNVDLDPCGHTTPCENGATCNNTGSDQHECLCAAGFEGDSCERETNECDPNPCMNGGSCTNLLAAGYSCSCAAGFEGDSCERETNECDPNPCLNGGACIDLVAGYNCSCPGGFSGINCDQKESGDSGGTSGTLLVPVVWGVAGGLLFLVMVLATVVICLCIKLRNMTPAASKDHTPPKENVDLNPNPVYGISTSHTPSQEDIELNPNPGYGVSVPQESQTNADYYTLDHTHKASGTMTDIYEYVSN